MRLEHYSEKKLKEELLKIIGKHLNLSKYKVFVFGSRVTGKGDDRSDIDVGIEGPEPVSSAAKLEIAEEVENLPTLYKIEIVDFSQVPDKFKLVAKETIELLN